MSDASYMRILLALVLAMALISTASGSAKSFRVRPLLTYTVSDVVDRSDPSGPEGGICATDPGGRSFRVVDPYQDRGPAWSPDGSWVAFSRSLERPPPVDHLSDIFITDVRGEHRRNLTRVAGGTLNGDPVWSPDGTTIAFVTAAYGASLNIINSDASGFRGVFGVPWPQALDLSSWSPDGRQLLVTIFDPSDPQGPRIYAIEAGSGKRTELAQTAVGGVWSPDGRRIAYTAREANEWTLDLAQADGRNPSVLAHGLGPGGVAWAPDGNWIAFTRDVVTKSSIWLIRPDGTGEHAAHTGGLAAGSPAWRPAAALPGNRRPCVVTGTSRAEVIRGTSRGDLIDGLGGNDTIYGGGGDDVLVGGRGHDRLYGGPGRDLFGARDSTRDLLIGGRGFDSAYFDKRDRLTSVELNALTGAKP